MTDGFCRHVSSAGSKMVHDEQDMLQHADV